MSFKAFEKFFRAEIIFSISLCIFEFDLLCITCFASGAFVISLFSSKLLTVLLFIDLVIINWDLADSEFALAVIPVNFEAASAL